MKNATAKTIIGILKHRSQLLKVQYIPVQYNYFNGSFIYIGNEHLYSFDLGLLSRLQLLCMHELFILCCFPYRYIFIIIMIFNLFSANHSLISNHLWSSILVLFNATFFSKWIPCDKAWIHILACIQCGFHSEGRNSIQISLQQTQQAEILLKNGIVRFAPLEVTSEILAYPRIEMIALN